MATWPRFTIFTIFPLLLQTSGLDVASSGDSLQQKLGDFGLVKPKLTDAEGGFLSHAISCGPAGRQFRRRWRREAGPPPRLYYNVTVFGRDLHLRLRLNSRLVAPGAKMEWRDQGAVEPLLNDCVYVGRVTDMRHTAVALSTCDGLGLEWRWRSCNRTARILLWCWTGWRGVVLCLFWGR
ncbi:A disintegrin and metalloproteinase with thrombospondin motifs 2-like isoform X2 [Denticeps clupeoides]|uniref:A disintegrin and metalloproteinase with thrombospondin motifs 2-like isoform X2 n=1 Tax=Denticeps clupeoides TaxID=299321 RepID=UPI0010A37467|nr:A disintegrin and metalloproteinase with thrombospondin motifs 2-like isoform X2 [Denticeps clupeoides]